MPLPPFLPAPERLVLKAINQLLLREPWAAQQLAQYAGKSVVLALEPWSLGFFIDDGGTLRPLAAGQQADVRLFLPAAKRSQAIQAWQSSGIDGLKSLMQIQGDAGLAQLVAELLACLRPDLEHELASRFGDLPGLRLFACGRSLVSALRAGGQSVQANLTEYLQQPSALVATRAEYAALHDQASDLQSVLAALAGRINKLEAR